MRLLTTPRFLGFGYNPVSFFYLYSAEAETVEAVIAEVTNTPCGERHAYVLFRHLSQVPATIARSYANALRSRRKGLPVHPHPRPGTP